VGVTHIPLGKASLQTASRPILGLSDDAVASRKTADRDIIFGNEPAEGNFASDRYLPVAIHDFDLAIGRYWLYRAGCP
jgi:hypothetical protein